MSDNRPFLTQKRASLKVHGLISQASTLEDKIAEIQRQCERYESRLVLLERVLNVLGNRFNQSTRLSQEGRQF
jgi:hypothetical protein